MPSFLNIHVKQTLPIIAVIIMLKGHLLLLFFFNSPIDVRVWVVKYVGNQFAIKLKTTHRVDRLEGGV